MSQDVNTPRVIASHFLARAPAGRTPFLRKVPPESLPMMDEVDGKPGPVALQFGHLDALNRVPTASLSLPSKFTVILSEAQRSRRSCVSTFSRPIFRTNTQITGEHHENLPGK